MLAATIEAHRALAQLEHLRSAARGTGTAASADAALGDDLETEFS